jgi:hypothetical protein
MVNIDFRINVGDLAFTPAQLKFAILKGDAFGQKVIRVEG